MSDPQIERALEEFFEAERLSRRGFIGRAGSTGLRLSGPLALPAACRGVQGEGAKAWLALEEGAGFSRHLWDRIDGRALQNRWRGMQQIPVETPLSIAIS